MPQVVQRQRQGRSAFTNTSNGSRPAASITATAASASIRGPIGLSEHQRHLEPAMPHGDVAGTALFPALFALASPPDIRSWEAFQRREACSNHHSHRVRFLHSPSIALPLKTAVVAAALSTKVGKNRCHDSSAREAPAPPRHLRSGVRLQRLQPRAMRSCDRGRFAHALTSRTACFCADPAARALPHIPEGRAHLVSADSAGTAPRRPSARVLL